MKCKPCHGTGTIWVATPDGDADSDVCDWCDGTGISRMIGDAYYEGQLKEAVNG